MIDYRRLANVLAAPVFGTFLLYVLVGRTYVRNAAGPTVALILEIILAGLVLFVGVSDLYTYWRQRQERSD